MIWNWLKKYNLQWEGLWRSSSWMGPCHTWVTICRFGIDRNWLIWFFLGHLHICSGNTAVEIKLGNQQWWLFVHVQCLVQSLGYLYLAGVFPFFLFFFVCFTAFHCTGGWFCDFFIPLHLLCGFGYWLLCSSWLMIQIIDQSRCCLCNCWIPTE